MLDDRLVRGGGVVVTDLRAEDRRREPFAVDEGDLSADLSDDFLEPSPASVMTECEDNDCFVVLVLVLLVVVHLGEAGLGFRGVLAVLVGWVVGLMSSENTEMLLVRLSNF